MPDAVRHRPAASPQHVPALPLRETAAPLAPPAVSDRVAPQPLAGVRYGRELAAAAAAYRLDPTLVAAVAAQESGGPGALSGRADAGRDNPFGKGLMQLNPAHHPFARTPAAYDPGRSAHEGAKVLRENLDRAHGDVREAIREYDCGPNAPRCTGEIARWPDGPLPYVDSVLRHQRDIRAFERQ